MPTTISVAGLRAVLYATSELGFFDVREAGQIGEGHILFSAPLPYSVFELQLPNLAPNPAAPLVLYDNDDGVAVRAAKRAEGMGYSDVSVLEGGVTAWAAAGHVLYKGVNVPSKVFGELVEHAEDTPRIAPLDLVRRQEAGERIVILDGRPLDEYRKMNIPGASCCPNGELVHRISTVVPDAETTVVINCAGRTRSIIGAQTLIDAGIPNPVIALENGTQGWTLSGLQLEHGRQGELPDAAPADPTRKTAVTARAEAAGVQTVDSKTLAAWLKDKTRTTYLLDVRSAEDRAADSAEIQKLLATHGVVHAPGGQLVQATDQWVGVRRARVVVLDTEELRAPVVATWLAKLGHTAAIVQGGLNALGEVAPGATIPSPKLPTLKAITLEEALAVEAILIDLRASATYREGHPSGAVWSIRPRITDAIGQGLHVLIADDPDIARLAAIDLSEAGITDVALLEADTATFRTITPTVPTDAERIDYLFFVHDRHTGNADASRAYLAWETGLIAQLDTHERTVFKV